MSYLLRGALSLALWVALLGAGSAAAQERRYDLERFRPALDPDGFLTFNGTRTPGPLRYDFGVAIGYASEQLILRVPTTGERFGVLTDRVFGDLTFQLGLGGIVAIAVDAPFVLYQLGDGPAIDGGMPLQAAAIRDPRFSGRIRLFGEDATIERERHEGEGLALQAAITAPIGHERAFAGEGAPQLEVEVLADFHILDIAIGGMLGYRHRFAEPSVVGVGFRNQMYFAVGLQVPTFFVEDLVSLAEVDVTTDLENPFGNQSSTVVEWRAGLRLRVGDAAITAMGGSGFVGGVGSPGFRGVLGVTFSPRVHDRDHDGIVDENDECASLPEDFDSNEDENGCPEPDNDHDLVPDLDDACPNEAAEEGRDLDDDGCTDPVNDADGDGIDDDSDGCPMQPEDLDGFEDDDGCPDLDEDNDTVPLPADACPAEAEDRDGWQDGDGCPDPDDDHDSILDADDRCPREAEDADAFEPTDGCPEPDDDRDGVLDGADTCPDAAETINGRRDADGCADPGRGVFRVVGAAGTDAFAIEGTIAFAPDGSLPETAAGAIEQLAMHLRADWGATHHVEVNGPNAEAQQTALEAALASRGVTGVQVVVGTDRRAIVRARRGPVESGGRVLTLSITDEVRARAGLIERTEGAPELPPVPPPNPIE